MKHTAVGGSQPSKRHAARPVVVLCLAIAILALGACRSSNDTGVDAGDRKVDTGTDAEDGAAASTTSFTQPKDAPPSQIAGLEVSTGPASILATVTAVLPDEEDLDARWARNPVPYIERPEECGQLVPVASSERGFVDVSTEAVVLPQLSFGIAVFDSEEDAARYLSDVNGPVADVCDELLLPQLEAELARQSAGVYSVDEESAVGLEAPIPSDLVDAARRYDLIYTGSTAPVDVNLEILFAQRGRYVLTASRAALDGAESDPGGLTELERMVGEIEVLPEPTPNPDLDDVGELVRRAVPVHLVPERFDLQGTAELRRASEQLSCDDPDDHVVDLELEGPVWFALSARSGERLALSSFVFVSAQDAADYMTVVSDTGAECLSSFEPWPASQFSSPSYSAETQTLDGVDVITLRATAVQELADLDVEVEAVVHLARHDRFVVAVQWAGLAGDGDAALEMAVEMTRRLDS